jgi:toxin ParE1/3/4
LARLTISKDARRDLSSIYLQGVQTFGPAQADRYIDALLDVLDMIADFPEISRLRTEIEPPVRAYTHQSHVILYDFDANGDVMIVRIRHVLEDWQGLNGVGEP